MKTFVRFGAGVVKGGVIVPDAPLPEDAYVEIVVPNAPREVVERVRFGGSDQGGLPDGGEVIAPEVAELVRYHGAEKSFAAVMQLARDCFAPVQALRAYVKEDDDERGWLRVVVEVILPANHPHDLLRQQRELYREGCAQ